MFARAIAGRDEPGIAAVDAGEGHRRSAAAKLFGTSERVGRDVDAAGGEQGLRAEDDVAAAHLGDDSTSRDRAPDGSRSVVVFLRMRDDGARDGMLALVFGRCGEAE